MKTNALVVKESDVIYRKDGKTPDLRYKSSRAFVYAQYLEKHKGNPNDGNTHDFKYQHMRDHVVSTHVEQHTTNRVQIKPSGKKPVWKVL